MNRDRRIVSCGWAWLPVVLGGFLLGPAAGVGQAADCKALAEAIGKERTLMTRKTMIEEAMKVCPRDAEIVYQQGYTLERLRKYDEALRSYKRALALDSDSAKVHFSVGDIQMIMKNYQEAAEAYESGLQHEPGDARAKGSLQDARKMYQEATGKTLVSSKTPPEKPEVKPEAKPEAKPEPKIEVKVEEGPIQLVAPILRLQVPFASGEAELSQDSQDALSVVVGQAMRRKDMQATRFEVAGHTDNAEDAGKGQELARRRAEVVQRYLIENFGISADRLPVSFYGPSRPRLPNTSPANQEGNRRVEFAKMN